MHISVSWKDTKKSGRELDNKAYTTLSVKGDYTGFVMWYGWTAQFWQVRWRLNTAILA